MSRIPRLQLFATLAVCTIAASVASSAPPSKPAAPTSRTAPAAKSAAPSRPTAETHPFPAGSTPRTDLAGNDNAISPEADSLISAMNKHYLAFSNYDIQGNSHMIMTIAGAVQNVDVPFRLAAAKPARLRNEIMNPMMPYVNMSDGSKTWVYLPQTGQYTEKDAAPLTSVGGSSADIGNAMALGTPLQRYLSAHQGLIAARVLGSETVNVAGTPVNCIVVDAQYATPDSTRFTLSPNRFWIDPERRLVVRDSLQVGMSGPDGSPVSMATVTTFSKLDVDGVLPDSLFAFRPPATAKKVDSFDVPGMKEQVSPLVGKPAEEFALLDLAGKRHSLAGLRGKVVLLDFWATWCGPCRRELPTIAKLHKELAAKGLAVVAVNVGESATTVSGYLKKNQFTIPVWLDSQTEVSRKYGASSIPTLVVIDRAGKVSAYKVGMREEADLRALLTAAGLK